jgi:hypothetical protein
MLAFPTPTFDAKTILQAPGYRPVGRGSCLEYEPQPEAVTPLNLVNRHTSNGAFVGTRAKHFIQNNQFNTSMQHYDPTKGTPLSKPGSVGNVDTQAISIPPKYAEPENGELRAIMAVLNGKGAVEEHIGKLSAKQVQSLGKTSKHLNKEAPERFREAGPQKVVQDFSDAREALRKEAMIRRAISMGFSKEEAAEAYRKTRVREAEIALTKEEDPSTRLYDLIDSKIAGTQNGSYRSNDETGLFLAKGGNAIMEVRAEKRNDQVAQVIAKSRGRPKDVELAEKHGLTIDEIKESRRMAKQTASVLHPFFVKK